VSGRDENAIVVFVEKITIGKLLLAIIFAFRIYNAFYDVYIVIYNSDVNTFMAIRISVAIIVRILC
jgi:hypothetical protein